MKTGTSEKVNQSRLLGEVAYSATVTNNGETQDRTYASGDKIELEEGSLLIDVVAHYLEYNTVSTHLDYSIYTDKTMNLEIVQNPVYKVTKDGLEAEQPILIRVTLEGQEISGEVWSQMTETDLQVVLSADEALFGQPLVKKSSTAGIYEIYPTGPENGLASRLYGEYPFTAHFEHKNGEAVWAGDEAGALKTEDTRSWWQRYREKAIRMILWGILILLILGYFPMIKPRLPKKLARRPLIKGDSRIRDFHRLTRRDFTRRNCFTACFRMLRSVEKSSLFRRERPVPRKSRLRPQGMAGYG